MARVCKPWPMLDTMNFFKSSLLEFFVLNFFVNHRIVFSFENLFYTNNTTDTTLSQD